jgi:hypothetical protein
MQLETGLDPYGPAIPYTEGVLIQSYGGALTFKSSLGGQNLGVTSLYLPIGYGDLKANGGLAWFAKAIDPDDARLIANPNDRTSLTPSFRTTSAIASVRHDFGHGVEAFIDGIYLQNNTRWIEQGRQLGIVEAADPFNVFQQTVQVTYPMPNFAYRHQEKLESYRVTAGVIASLGRDWRGEASYSFGGVRTSDFQLSENVSNDLFYATYYTYRSYLPPGFNKPIPNIFGSWSQFVDDVEPYKSIQTVKHLYHQWFQAGNLRLGGPLVHTDAGPVSLTLNGEWRREAVGAGEYFFTMPQVNNHYFYQPYIQTALSAHAEMRAPLLSRDSKVWPLRGLELQLAERYDDYIADVPTNYGEDRATASRKTFASVAGLRFFPLNRLMVRGSVATGTLPPPPELLAPSKQVRPLYLATYTADPRRGYEQSYQPVTLWGAGSPKLKSERARTFSAGLVLNPEGGERPRVSLDYTRIEKRGEINTNAGGSYGYFILTESLYPDRVKRAPLTAADIAAGYTGGVILEIDATPLNVGRATIETVDLKVDYRRSVGSAAVARLYGSTTWTRRFFRSQGPEDEGQSYLGTREGPIVWRANGGVDLDYGPWTVGLNGQFYGPYDDATIYGLSVSPSYTVIPRVGSQFYLDFNGAYRFERPGDGAIRSLELRFGVANLLDESGPVTLHDYSPFGDPRGRRFETAITARF